MDERTSRHRLNPWIAAWLGLNTALSLTAIGVWVTTQRKSAVHPPNQNQTATQPPIVMPLGSSVSFAPTARPHFPSVPIASPIAARGSHTEPISPPSAFVPSWHVRSQQVPPPSATVTVLAERTRIRLEAFAELVDERGEVPKTTAKRLESGVEAAERAAERLGLDEGKTQSFVAIVTHGVFSLLREELNGATGKHFEEIVQPILDDVRLLCGEKAAEEAENLLGRI